jgi:isoleucyl-tRNA synthetase
LTVADAEEPLTAEDVVLRKDFGDDWAGASDGMTVILIDKRVTPQLKNEGIARDIIRNVQNLRKVAGLDIADRIKLSLVTDSDAIKDAVEQCSAYILSETLGVELSRDPLGGSAARGDVKIDGGALAIELVRVA